MFKPLPGSQHRVTHCVPGQTFAARDADGDACGCIGELHCRFRTRSTEGVGWPSNKPHQPTSLPPLKASDWLRQGVKDGNHSTSLPQPSEARSGGCVSHTCTRGRTSPDAATDRACLLLIEY